MNGENQRSLHCGIVFVFQMKKEVFWIYRKMKVYYQYKPSTLNMNGKQEVVGKVTQGTKSYKALFQTALGDDAHYWLASHCIRNGR